MNPVEGLRETVMSALNGDGRSIFLLALEKQLRRIDRGADGRITVYYNPRNPKKSFLIRPGRISLLITLLIGIAPLLFFCKYHVQT